MLTIFPESSFSLHTWIFPKLFHAHHLYSFICGAQTQGFAGSFVPRKWCGAFVQGVHHLKHSSILELSIMEGKVMPHILAILSRSNIDIKYSLSFSSWKKRRALVKYSATPWSDVLQNNSWPHAASAAGLHHSPLAVADPPFSPRPTRTVPDSLVPNVSF